VYIPELQTFGRVDGHHGYKLAAVVLLLVGVGNQGNILQKGG
jgi:hypothetical protein